MRKLRSLIVVAVLAIPISAQCQPSDDPKVAVLANSLRATMTSAERHADAAGFPRRNTLAAVSRSIWETFYRGDYTAAEESAAVDLVAADAASPVLKEAATRMKYELQLN